MQIRDRIALVTGTSSGIGAALAESLLEEDWAVLGISRRAPALDSPHYRHFQCDLGDLVHLNTLAETELLPIFSDACWSRIGLVNNAAHLGSLCSFQDLKAAQVAGVLAINSVAPIFLMGLMIRAVPSETKLRIVNVSSGAAHQGIPGLTDYCASKAALRIAGAALGAELDSTANVDQDRDVRILSYEPGIVDTSMQEAARGATPGDFPSHELFRGFAERDELHAADAVIGPILEFLAGPAGESFSEGRYGIPEAK